MELIFKLNIFIVEILLDIIIKKIMIKKNQGDKRFVAIIGITHGNQTSCMYIIIRVRNVHNII